MYVLYTLMQQQHHRAVKRAVRHHFRRSTSQSHRDTGPQPCPQRPALQHLLLHPSPKIYVRHSWIPAAVGKTGTWKFPCSEGLRR